MRRIVLLLLCLAAPALVLAGARSEIYTADARGEITIGADGRVLAVELDDRAALGREVASTFERQVSGWRFEPILEDGRPVNAIARMQLRLVAINEAGEDGTRIGIRQVWFTDPPGAAPATGASAFRMAPPAFPNKAGQAGFGADLMLVLRLDNDGAVVDAAVDTAHLLGPSGIRTAEAGRRVKEFSDASLRAAADWSIPGIPGNVVRVPVRFHLDPGAVPGSFSGWHRTHAVPVDVPAWVLALEGDEVSLSGGGAASGHVRLLTTLDPMDPDDGG